MEQVISHRVNVPQNQVVVAAVTAAVFTTHCHWIVINQCLSKLTYGTKLFMWCLIIQQHQFAVYCMMLELW